MKFFFDTETTGLPDFKARSLNPKQPHLVQLATILCEDNGNEVAAQSVIIRPDGWTIPPEVTAIHGISHAQAMDEGIPEADAVALFVMAQARGAVRIAHNESFDRRIMRIAMARAGLQQDFILAIEGRPVFCTCNEAKPIMNLPPTEKMRAAGFTGPKSPNLTECIKHFFSEDLGGAHDAMVDARACARIFWRLQHLKESAA